MVKDDKNKLTSWSKLRSPELFKNMEVEPLNTRVTRGRGAGSYKSNWGNTSSWEAIPPHIWLVPIKLRRVCLKYQSNQIFKYSNVAKTHQEQVQQGSRVSEENRMKNEDADCWWLLWWWNDGEAGDDLSGSSTTTSGTFQVSLQGTWQVQPD